MLAGPLTSIVFGVLMIPMVIVTESVMADLLCLMPIAMGLACIIPMKMKTGFLYNDGTRYKRLHSGGQEGAEKNALFKLIEVSLFGGEKCIYPVTYVEPLLVSADKDLQYYGFFMLIAMLSVRITQRRLKNSFPICRVFGARYQWS